MIEYLDTVLIHYVVENRQEMELADDHPALALFDVFAAHHSNEVLSKLRASNIHQIFVPASCTRELQPLDIGINGDFKQLMKASFSRWHSDDVRAAMDEGQSVSNIK
uniref:DDE-1 domain-containing protein n=1 Tax=Amphimedon queenslandica TaxID=400682 RepID=A0A1X7U1C7_AMPQE